MGEAVEYIFEKNPIYTKNNWFYFVTNLENKKCENKLKFRRNMYVLKIGESSGVCNINLRSH